ncbi:hypothetical protein GCM10017586_03700 [Microbacterium imperiale]|uniref:Uncharacterized protein n=1 Tax=Microbacterium imperiale TaxID=33884 RepID=A0A9W6M1N7_9MICO|nr:hypothetical protein GCM10017544_12920 [Microbacterium imperiale]GLJ78688.1 hypothetical protein GCM10017586_03700 [Microbacterium imperiale]
MLSETSWRARVGGVDREVRIAPGGGFGWGVVDRTEDEASIILPAAATGSVWHLVTVHRDWQNNLSSFDSIPAGATKAIPDRATTPGTADDQPLWLARVDAGKSQVQELVDLRVWGSDGGSFANDLLVRQYLDRLGTVIRIGAGTWARTLDALGQKTWTAIDSGRLLGVYPLKWADLPPSGSVRDQGIVVWNEQSRIIAEFDLPDPGVPYRVQMMAQGFWGRELEPTGARYDFDAMVGGTAIATKLPAGDEFMFSNWRSWSPWPSQQVFTGAQKLGFRARRIYGPAWGAVQPSQSIVVASVFSA